MVSVTDLKRKVVDLKKKVAVVTGASSGIGFEFCRVLADAGCELVLISNQTDELSDAAKSLSHAYGVATHTLCLDLTAPDAVETVAAFMGKEGLEADILINNAGIFSFAPVVETSERKLGCFVDLHVRAVTMLSRWFAGEMSGRGGGYILNMSSMSCWMPMPGIAMYSATKAYIRVFTRALHYEMRDSGVKVMVACPGGIATNLFGLPPNLLKLAVRIKALDTPEAFSRKALIKLLKGKKQYINGFINRFSIFLVAVSPTCVRMLVKRLMLDKGIRR